jgi:hypothetical protein
MLFFTIITKPDQFYFYPEIIISCLVLRKGYVMDTLHIIRNSRGYVMDTLHIIRNSKGYVMDTLHIRNSKGYVMDTLHISFIFCTVDSRSFKNYIIKN